MLDLGEERQNWMRPILAFSTRAGPLARCTAPWAKIRPLTSFVSSIVPPSFFVMRMSFSSTLVAVAGSITCRTESTASGASSAAFWDTTLELSEVLAAWMRDSRLESSTGMATSCRISMDFAAAFLKPRATTFGWMPLAKRSLQQPSSAPAVTTTDVVPSPASTSCALESSTIIWAAGCSSFSSLMIVAPSLVISTSPLGRAIILSMPRGPRLVLTMSATALAASMLEPRMSASFSFSWNWFSLIFDAIATLTCINA
mmetsp:Transcript_13083/g.52187  ORF Transcript_13083/g.52187 Transcript_13083/m.52187 type:complete len:257 (-) Transcript_13083:119-889(-)